MLGSSVSLVDLSSVHLDRVWVWATSKLPGNPSSSSPFCFNTDTNTDKNMDTKIESGSGHQASSKLPGNLSTVSPPFFKIQIQIQIKIRIQTQIRIEIRIQR